MKRTLLLILLPAAVAGCASGEPKPTGTARIEFKVYGMTCEGCAANIVRTLREHPAVADAAVDFGTGQGHAEVRTGGPSLDELARLVKDRFGFELRPPGEGLDPVPEGDLDVQTISIGEAIEETDHLVTGKATLFDYFAEWCGPCHLLDRDLRRLVKKNPRVAVRRIDIVDWDSAAAERAKRQIGLTALPFVRVYGPDGRFLGSVVGNHIDKIEELIIKEE